MKGITPQGIPAPAAVPGVPMPYDELLQEFPELADDIAALTSVRDVGQQDRRDKGFEKRYPSMKPGATSA